MKIITDKQKEMMKKHGLRMVVLFGSQVSGEANEKSDYDIAVLTVPEKNIAKNLKDYNDILFLLEKILSIPAEKIDLTNLQTVTPLLLHEIFENSELLYGDELDYEEQRARAFRKYIDAKPLFELHRIIIKKRQKLLKKKIYA
jgi:predicted nucleotidyltransferase